MPTTSLEQYLLELINEARLNPMGNAARYISSYAPLTSTDSFIQSALSTYNVDGAALQLAFKSLVPVAPLAWNDALANAAASHSAAMIKADEQSHQLAGEADLAGRLTLAGYTGYSVAGENIYAFASNLPAAHAAFMVDWGEGPNGMQSPAGHRLTIMSAQYTEVGIDVTNDTNRATKVGPFVVTQDFGARGVYFVTGVAYNDDSRDSFYTMGEGVAGLVVSAGRTSTTSGASGGYNLQLPNGLVSLTLSGGGLDNALNITTTMANENLKLDVVNGNTLLTSGDITVVGAIATIKVINAAGASVTSGAGAQSLRGLSGNDVLDGGIDDDTLLGNDGDDTLLGGAGRDNLDGGAGNDILDGGTEIDIANYAGKRGEYTVSSTADGGISISGGTSGTDVLRNIEFIKFADGQFAIKDLGVITNQAPAVPASQAIVTKPDTAKQVLVNATDADGDRLTFTATGASHGTVTGGSGGVFVYTPTSGYAGTDAFRVSVSDGRGGIATQSVSVTIQDINAAPVAAATQSVVTKQDTAKQVKVTATDPDGDALTFTATAAAHGTVTGGTAGAFTYTPTTGYTGADSFKVSVNDGHGHTVQQTVNVQVSFVAQASAIGTGNAFRLFMANGLVGDVGGTGTIIGTNGFQDVTLVNQPGEIVFDTSFSRGGDIIRLPGNASLYSANIDGSLARLSDGDTTFLIPIGQNGTPLVFDDGVRSLYFNTQSNQVRIGTQQLFTTPAPLTAPTDGSALPTGADPNPSGRLFLAEGGLTSIGGDNYLFGTSGAEKVYYRGGELVLDATFNRGGDTLYMPQVKSAYQAYLSGSTLVLMSSDGEVFIPVGTVGLKIVFVAEELVLRFDQATQSVLIGNQVIDAVSPIAPDTLADIIGGGNEVSVDRGSAANAVTIDLDDGDFILIDDGQIETNVVVNGFGTGDFIRVGNADTSDYSFSTGSGPDGVNDLRVVARIGDISNEIVLIDAIQNPGFIFDLDSAEAAVGFEFITTGTPAGGGGSGGGGGGTGGGGGSGGGTGSEGSVDLGSPSNAVAIDLAGGEDHVLVDDGQTESNVIVHGFDLGDMIQVQNASQSDYTFGTGSGAAGADDLRIVARLGNVSNEILLVDVIQNAGFIYDLASAEAAVGGQFMTFG